MAEMEQSKPSQPLPPPSRPEVGWKGALRAVEVIRHRWQRDWTRHTHRSLQTRERWRHLRIVAALGGTAILLGILLYYLLYFPVRVPVLTLVVTDYSWPLAPNAWAQEDLASLQLLDEPGTQTLQLIDGSASWRTQQRGLRHLEDQLQQLAPQATRAGLLILYVSMHGAVNDLGEPCLLTRESIPYDSNTWFPVRTLLETVNAPTLIPASVRRLVILDCNRQRTHWDSGQLYNTFTERLTQLVSAEQFPHLAVLNSTGPGQFAVSSADLQGSVFGHFLHLGLAGAADLRAEGGNGNGRVSARELVHYLQHHVSQWTKQFTDDPQRPMLLPAELHDFDVAWRQNTRVLENLISRAEEIAPAAPTISRRERNELWRSRDEFLASQPHRFDPVAWRDLEHQLLWLEELAMSGSGYASRAVQVAQSARRRTNQISMRLREAREHPTLPKVVQAFAEGPQPLPREWSVHSLSLAGYLGSTDITAIQSGWNSWRQLVDDVSESHRENTFDQLQDSSLPQPLAEAQFLQFVQRYRLLPLWEATAVPQQAFRLQAAARRLDGPPSQNGMPGDERAHYWVQADLALADARRREAEDRLLSALDPSDTSLNELFSPALFEQAEADLNSIARSLERRDEAWARVVYWSRWLTRPQRVAAAQEIANHQINRQLLPLIELLHGFDEALVREVPDWELENDRQPPARRWSSSQLIADLERRSQEMKQLFEQETTRLLVAESDGARTLQDINQWLLLPICSWDQRNALQEKRERILDGLRRSYRTTPARQTLRSARSRSEDTSSSADSRSEDDGEPHPLRMLGAWEGHPASRILRLGEKSGAAADHDVIGVDRLNPDRPLDWCEEMGLLVRRRLRMLSRDEFLYGIEEEGEGEGEKFSGTSQELVVSGHDPGLSWAASCRAESRVRAAAPFYFPAPKNDPVHQLRRRDLQQLLLWNARRTLDDCWGSAGLSPTPFFVAVAESYLKQAEELNSADTAVRKQLDYLKSSLRARQLGIEQALLVTANDILFVDESATTSTRMVLRAGPSRELAGRSMPEGELIGFLGDDVGRFSDTTRVMSTTTLRVDEGNDLATWEFTLPGSTLVNRGPNLEAVTTFRGNEYRAPLLLRLVGGRVVNVDLPPVGTTEVTLRGPTRRRASLQFILDCSQSMSELETVEAPGVGPTNQQPRIDVARQALEALLRQLAAENEHRIGVRFFGHRAGWSVVESGKLLRQTQYVGEIPEGLQPYEDVELVLPLGRFDESSLGTVLRHLRSVRPWGETPLYLSLIDSLRDFSREEGTGKRTIVAITDGLNYQFNPPREYAKLASDVLDAAAGQDVTIFIVGFGIPTRDQARAQAEFSMIAEATGGTYVSATNASLLLRSLEALLRPSEFQLFDEIGNVIGSAPMGETIQVSPVSPLPERFHLAYEGLTTPLDLRGGERVQLQVSPDGSRLESARVGNSGFPQQEFSDSTHQPVGVRGRAHRPVREEGGVRFTVSLQRDDGGFLARPAEVWGEIRPVFAPGSEPMESSEPDYVFFDTVFARDEPVPVLHWFAERWPEEARRAEIRIWCRPYQEATPVDTVPLLSFADQVPRQGSGFTRATVPNISFQTRIVTSTDARDRQRVMVVERHLGRDSTVGGWRIDLRPTPRRIERRMDPTQQVALHTFFLEGVRPEELSQHELRFTSKSRFAEDAWYLPEPIVVEIADRGDLLQLSPAAEPR